MLLIFIVLIRSRSLRARKATFTKLGKNSRFFKPSHLLYTGCNEVLFEKEETLNTATNNQMREKDIQPKGFVFYYHDCYWNKTKRKSVSLYYNSWPRAMRDICKIKFYFPILLWKIVSNETKLSRLLQWANLTGR